MDELNQLEARIQKLGLRILEQKVARLEVRSWFLFFRVRRLLAKLRILKGDK